MAQDNEVKAAVTITIQQDQEIWTGQQVTLNLDLKTTGFSFSNTHFNLPEVSGAFLMQTDTTTIKMTEKVDNRDWQVVRYPLALYPQRSGPLEIPSINVRFTTSAGFGSALKAFEFETEPMQLTVALPPGAKQGDLVVTTTSFELDYDWQPASGASSTGDAVTLTVSRKAGDISAMLLPPLPIFRVDGLATYPQTPAVKDRTDRGDLTGERIDAITWVVEKPGMYEIPGIRFQWWDPGSRELKQQIVPGLGLDIQSVLADGPVPEATEESATNLRQARQLWIPGVAGLLLIAFWLFFGRKARQQHLHNEKAAFARLAHACKNNQAGIAYTALHTWIEFFPTAVKHQLHPITLSKFAQLCDDRQLTRSVQDLQEALTAAREDWQGSELLESLQRIRRGIKRQKMVRSKAHLAPLNP
jgi:hypothetical protein